MDKKIQEGIDKGILENKTVRLMPVKKQGKMINKPDHIGYFMFDDAFKNYVLPRDRRTGAYKPILDSDELAFFNEVLQQDLSFNKKDNNFWDKYSVRIVKNKALMQEGIKLDLKDPWQNLDYRLLKSLNVTAESYNDRLGHPRYIWYLANENEELEIEAKKTAQTQEVWTFLGSIMTSKKQMIDVLSVYFAQFARENEVDINSSKEWFVAELQKVATANPDFLLECKNNDDYKFKALITDAVRAGAIKKTHRNRYNLQGDPSNYDFNGLVKLLRKLKDETDDDYLRIIKTVEEFNKDKKLK